MNEYNDELRHMLDIIANSKNFDALTRDINELYAEFDKRTVKKEYSRCKSEIGGYYQKVPFMKIQVTNLDLGRKLSRVPKILDDVFVHDFDSNNILIRTTHHHLWGKEDIKVTEFFFREGEVEWSFVFHGNIYVNKIIQFSLSKFDSEGKMISYGVLEDWRGELKDEIRTRFKNINENDCNFNYYTLTYNETKVEIINVYRKFYSFPIKHERIKPDYDHEGYIVGGTYLNEDGTVLCYHKSSNRFKTHFSSSDSQGKQVRNKNNTIETKSRLDLKDDSINYPKNENPKKVSKQLITTSYLKNELLKKLTDQIKAFDDPAIYSLSLYFEADEGEDFIPNVYLTYNTESEFNIDPKSEERWNYAFWLQNEVPIIEDDESKADVLSWLKKMKVKDIGFEEGPIHDAKSRYIGKGPNGLVEILGLFVEIIKELHQTGFIKTQFKKELPVILHDLEYTWFYIEATKNANPSSTLEDFLSFYQ